MAQKTILKYAKNTTSINLRYCPTFGMAFHCLLYDLAFLALLLGFNTNFGFSSMELSSTFGVLEFPMPAITVVSGGATAPLGTNTLLMKRPFR